MTQSEFVAGMSLFIVSIRTALRLHVYERFLFPLSVLQPNSFFQKKTILDFEGNKSYLKQSRTKNGNDTNKRKIKWTGSEKKVDSVFSVPNRCLFTSLLHSVHDTSLLAELKTSFFTNWINILVKQSKKFLRRRCREKERKKLGEK